MLELRRFSHLLPSPFGFGKEKQLPDLCPFHRGHAATSQPPAPDPRPGGSRLPFTTLGLSSPPFLSFCLFDVFLGQSLVLVSEWWKLLELPELAQCEHQFQGCFAANLTTDMQGLACPPPSPSSSTPLMRGSCGLAAAASWCSRRHSCHMHLCLAFFEDA